MRRYREPGSGAFQGQCSSRLQASHFWTITCQVLTCSDLGPGNVRQHLHLSALRFIFIIPLQINSLKLQSSIILFRWRSRSGRGSGAFTAYLYLEWFLVLSSLSLHSVTLLPGLILARAAGLIKAYPAFLGLWFKEQWKAWQTLPFHWELEAF